MNQKMKKYLQFSLAILLLLLTAPGAASEEQASIRVVPGFNGVYKVNTLVPVKITVENKGADLSGHVTIAPAAHNAPRPDVTYIKEVFVPAGETEIIELMVPGNVFANNSQVNLMAGGNLVAWAPVQGLVVREGGTIILGVSSRGDIYKPLQEAQEKSGDYYRIFTGKTIQPADLPASLLSLQGAGIIVLDSRNRGDLTLEQEEALDKWVMAGGLLVVSEGANLQGNEAVGQVLAKVNGTPVLYGHTLGQGRVITSTYDLLTGEGIESATELQLWQEITRHNYSYDTYANERFWLDTWRYLDAANIFEYIKAPDLKFFAAILGIYLIVIGPMLYILLKRIDKRDWAWLAVPAIAIILAGGIMGAGKARITGEGTVQAVSKINILGPRLAVAEGAGAAIIPKGGSYSFAIPANTFAIPVVRGRMPGDMELAIGKDQDKMVNYRQVEYWSIRNLIFNTVLKDFGSIEGELALKEDMLLGSLINNTEVDLNKVIMIVGNNAFELGDWNKGESKNIERSLAWGQDHGMGLDRGYISPELRQGLTPQQERLFNSGVFHRGITAERVSVRDSYFEETRVVGLLPQEMWKISIIGWADDELEFFSISDLAVSQSSSHLITQELTVDLGGENKVFFPWGAIHPLYHGTIEHSYFSPTESGIILQGTTQVDFQLGKRFEVERLTNNFYDLTLGMATGAIYNWQTQTWDLLAENKLQVISNQQAIQYISEEGTLRVRFVNETGGRQVAPQPAIQVLGRVGHD